MKHLLAQGTPTPEGIGMSHYGQLAYEQRLTLELESLQLGLVKRSPIGDLNCPVIKNIALQIGQQGRITEHANIMKKKISEKLRENKAEFERRVKVKENWSAAVKRFLHKQEQRPAKKKKAVVIDGSDSD
jgi:hypothetical protein